MKPSKNNIIFCDDNHSSSSAPSSSAKKYWNNLSMIEWNGKCIDEAVKHINKRLLFKVIAACILIALIGFIVSSLKSPINASNANRSSNKNKSNFNRSDEFKQQRLLNKSIINDSIKDTSEAAMTTTITDFSKIIISSTEVTDTAFSTQNDTAINNNNHHHIKSINDNLHSSVLPTFNAANVITTAKNEHGKKSSDEVSLTKNYVSCR